jgi:hypothetical protein
MMTALRTMPEEFEIKEGWLHHFPSRHSFRFDPEGQVQIRAECNCSYLAVETRQSRALFDGYKEWQSNYWQPLLINREFASHFYRSPARNMLIRLTAWMHQRLLQRRHAEVQLGEMSAMSPAE